MHMSLWSCSFQCGFHTRSAVEVQAVPQAQPTELVEIGHAFEIMRSRFVDQDANTCVAFIAWTVGDHGRCVLPHCVYQGVWETAVHERLLLPIFDAHG